jgi:hypothetical protein
MPNFLAKPFFQNHNINSRREENLKHFFFVEKPKFDLKLDLRKQNFRLVILRDEQYCINHKQAKK